MTGATHKYAPQEEVVKRSRKRLQGGMNVILLNIGPACYSLTGLLGPGSGTAGGAPGVTRHYLIDGSR